MDEVATRGRLTALGLVTLALAAGAALSLWIYNTLWVQSAGVPAALDANENTAVVTWLVGWLLVAASAAGAVVLLIRVFRRIPRGRPALLDVFALGATVTLIATAVALAPLWGTASA